MHHRIVVLAAAVAATFLLNQATLAVVIHGQIEQGDYSGNGQATDYSIDKVYFEATAGTEARFDILAWELEWFSGSGWAHDDLTGEGEATRFDSYIYLFRMDGSTPVLVAANDDSNYFGTDGTIANEDSYLAWTLNVAGAYFLTIGNRKNNQAYSVTEALQGWASSGTRMYIWEGSNVMESDHAAWQLTMTVGNDVNGDPTGALSNISVQKGGLPTVPEPSTFAIWGSLSALGLLAARRRRLALRAGT